MIIKRHTCIVYIINWKTSGKYVCWAHSFFKPSGNDELKLWWTQICGSVYSIGRRHIVLSGQMRSHSTHIIFDLDNEWFFQPSNLLKMDPKHIARLFLAVSLHILLSKDVCYFSISNQYSYSILNHTKQNAAAYKILNRRSRTIVRQERAPPLYSEANFWSLLLKEI